MIQFSEPYEIIIRNKHDYLGPGEYIGRPSILGNPFEIHKHGTRNEVIELYRKYFIEAIQNDVQIQETMIQYLSILKEERTLNLICWCSPNACHGEVIKDFLFELLED